MNNQLYERGATLSSEAKHQGGEQCPLTVQIYYLTFLCDKQEFSYGFSLNYHKYIIREGENIMATYIIKCMHLK